MNTPLPPAPAWLLELGRPYSNYLVLAVLAGILLLGGALFQLGFIGWVAGLASRAMRSVIRRGFRLWERCFAWASWPLFLGIVFGLIAGGNWLATRWPGGCVLAALIVLFMGATACLAYMFIDLERYEVERGYKAVHNPMKGQEVAVHLVKYGPQVGVPLLIGAALGTVGGFALFNLGLYRSGGEDWYTLNRDQGPASFLDFLVATLLQLLRVVDVLKMANSSHILHMEYVSAAAWPATLPLTAFKSFFTLVLLQQVLASLRLGRLLSDTVKDFWSPHEPIHMRARDNLPQFGATAVKPLLNSLRDLPALTREQRDQLPRIIATVGPSSVPILMRRLADPHDHVRAVAASALGLLNARDALGELLARAADPSEFVRQSAVGALGAIAAPGSITSRRPRPLQRLARATHRGGYFGWRSREPADPVAIVLPALEAALEDGAAAVRIGALQALGTIGSGAGAATPKLVPLLGDSDESVRCEAALAIGKIGDPQGIAVAPLVAMLDDASLAVKTASARALGQLGKAAAAAVSALVPLLQNPEEGVREAAAAAIAAIGTLDESATDSLLEGLASEDNVVRAQTAEALGTIGEAAVDVAPALVEAMADRNDVVRARAVEALGKIGGSAAGVAVTGLVHALRDTDNWVSALAAEALGQMGESAEVAVPALVRSLGHANPLVRGNAAAALGQMGPAAASAGAALLKACGDAEGSVRELALRALSALNLHTPALRDSLLASLEDEDPRVRTAAVEALGRCEGADPAAVAPLLKLLDDSNDEVKVEAAKVLPRLAGPTPELIAALAHRLQNDDSDWVREHAAQALGKLGAAAASAGPVLLDASRTGEVGVREQALRAIVMIQPPEAAEAFASSLSDSSPDIRMLASAGWMKMPALPDDVIPSLIEALNDPEVRVRANAAHALARLEALPGEAVSRLIACTEDADEGLRLAAAIALKPTAGNGGGAALRKLLDDANPRIRLVAAGALLAAGADDSAADSAVVEALADPSVRVRRAALDLVETLGERGEKYAPILKERAEREEDAETRATVGRLLGKEQIPNSISV